MKPASSGLALGEALYIYASRRGSEKEAAACLSPFSEALKEEPRLLSYLNDPSFERAEKEGKLERLLQGAPAYFRSWARLAFRKSRSAFDPEAVLEGFYKPYDLARSHKRGTVYSARRLGEKEKEELRLALGGDDVTLVYKVDPALIGGYRIYLDGRLIERSIEGRLDEAGKKLLSQED